VAFFDCLDGKLTIPGQAPRKGDSKVLCY